MGHVTGRHGIESALPLDDEATLRVDAHRVAALPGPGPQVQVDLRTDRRTGGAVLVLDPVTFPAAPGETPMESLQGEQVCRCQRSRDTSVAPASRSDVAVPTGARRDPGRR